MLSVEGERPNKSSALFSATNTHLLSTEIVDIVRRGFIQSEIGASFEAQPRTGWKNLEAR